jgi:hypothetical protein
MIKIFYNLSNVVFYDFFIADVNPLSYQCYNRTDVIVKLFKLVKGHEGLCYLLCDLQDYVNKV